VNSSNSAFLPGNLKTASLTSDDKINAVEENNVYRKCGYNEFYQPKTKKPTNVFGRKRAKLIDMILNASKEARNKRS